jgi:AcrR family transcriptional regulator
MKSDGKTSHRRPVKPPQSRKGPFQPPQPPPEWTPPEPGSPRARILEEARRLFADHGLERTSIREITTAANVNAAMVHYYFGNKDELYRRVLGLGIIALIQAVLQQFPQNVEPIDIVTELPIRVMRILRTDPTWGKLVRQEIGMGAPHLEHVIHTLSKSGPLGARTEFEALYHSAVMSGDVRDLPPSIVLHYLLILGYSAVFFETFFHILEGVDPNQDTVFEERIRTFREIIRYGLLTDSKRRRKP